MAFLRSDRRRSHARAQARAPDVFLRAELRKKGAGVLWNAEDAAASRGRNFNIGENMKRRWLVLVGKTEAKIFEYFGARPTIHKLWEVANPEGKLKEQELVSDRPGRAARTKHTQRSPMAQEHSSKETVQRRFIERVCAYLAQQKDLDAFDTILLVAEPGTLGRLRPAVAAHHALEVEAEIPHDLLKATEPSILEHAYHVLTPQSPEARSS